ncbi:F-box/kelch-repeat protein At3g06240-like [Rutidosis leptorrhynchoides]|uniref:F-box/kelch-repeat protein At3g06240-like n=1 Tax=Rutidosis leptorrhynchoides TaxID=125765 RepID=UPI003A995B6B
MSSINIPPEIMTDILYRLPAKSVGRFRCVSKDWLSQLSSPQFIMTHQNTLNQKHFVLVKSSLYSIPFSNHSLEVSRSPTELRLGFTIDTIWYTIHGSCNGLVLLSFYNFNLRYTRTLSVLNPTTRDLIRLPQVVYNQTSSDLFGFGYDSLTDDYKVVTIRLYNDYDTNFSAGKKFVYVYSLRTKNWTRLSDATSSDYSILIKDSLTSAVFVNGILHWFGKKLSDNLPVIVALSLTNEKFSEVSIPIFPNDVDIKYHCQLVDVGGKLGIFSNAKGTIWLMNEYGVKESWTKILLHGFDRHSMSFQPMISYDKGKFLVADHLNRLLIYDIKERRLSETGEISFDELIGSYIESLVSPKIK